LPWNVESAFVLTEAAAYPVFCWTALALVRAIEDPSRRRDALALGAIALAYFTRTQFLVLAGVFPLAVLLRDGRAAPRRHRLLAAAAAVAAVAAIVVQVTGGLSRVPGRGSRSRGRRTGAGSGSCRVASSSGRAERTGSTTGCCMSARRTAAGSAVG